MSRSIETLKRLRDDFEFYAPRVLKILTKDGNIVPFALNRAQKYVHDRLERQLRETGKVRALVLKGRQQGISTYIQGRLYHKIQFRKGRKAFILTHEQQATDNLFTMTNRYHENVPEQLRPHTGAANAKELYFDKLDSGYKVATAGTKEVGRSNTAQFFHGSEAAFWPHAAGHFAGIGQAVPNLDGTEIILESTANGVGNEFHSRWLRAEAGQGEFIAIFCPWFWQPEYRKAVPKDFIMTPDEAEIAALYSLEPEQILWRRMKIEDDFAGDESLFHQEYPCNAAEAFVNAKRDSLIPANHIMLARKCTEAMASGSLVIGVDPARYGDDRTAIVWRQGRVVHKCITYEKKSTMQVAGIVAGIIDSERPDRVFIDVVGLGVGIYDRLVEMGYGETVVGVQASEKADDEEHYRNKRAEMWCRMRDWFAGRPVKIPDSDEFMTDLIEPGYTYDSNQRILIESKEQIKKREARSPDIADALSLTFAESVRPKKKIVINAPSYDPLDTTIGW